MNKDLKIIYGVWIFVIASSIIILPLISAEPGLTDNLVAYYKLDETSGVVIDELGTNNGTNSGATPNVTGKINTAYDFDSAGDYISGAAVLGYDDFSISAWFNSDSISDIQIISESRYTGSGGPILSIFLENNKLTARLRSNTGSGINTLYHGTTLSSSTWYFGVFTFDQSAGIMSLSLNAGTPVTSTYTGGTFNNIDYNTIGYSITDGSGSFDGKIDEVGIWDGVLTPTEILELYNSGNYLTYPFVADTCTCAGAGNDWEIDMSDYCNITEACDLTTGKLSFTGSGFTNCNATINTTNLGDPGSSGVLYIQDSCLIEVN